MRVLITGAAGFIGTNLSLRFLKEGHEVIGVDNFACSKRSVLKNFTFYDKFEFIEADICEYDFKKISGEIDWIFNLACPASPPKYQKDPFFTIRTNTDGMFNVLELARIKKAKILQASTSEIYGDPLVHPQTEEYRGNVNTLGPRSCYDEGKRMAETICFEYRDKHGVDVKLVRIFNTYGPYMDPEDGRVITNFIKQSLNGENLTIYGDGTQTRSFQYIDDLLNAFVALMKKPKSIWGPFNTGNPNEFTIKELAETVKKITGTRAKIVYMPLPQDDPKKRRPDISKAKKILKWAPKVRLEEGLKHYIDGYRTL